MSRERHVPRLATLWRGKAWKSKGEEESRGVKMRRGKERPRFARAKKWLAMEQ